MAGEKISTNDYFCEYVFARVVENLNYVRLEMGEPVITVSKGRELHKQLVDAMAAGDYSPAKSDDGTMFIHYVNNVLKPYNNGQPVYYITDAKADERGLEHYGSYAEQKEKSYFDMTPHYDENRNVVSFYSQLVDEYRSCLGEWSKSRDNIQAVYDGKATADFSDSMMPISPYDERYAYRSNVLSHGSEILYVPIKDAFNFDVPDGDTKKQFLYKTEKEEESVHFYSRTVDPDTGLPKKNKNGKFMYRDAGAMCSPDDVSGLSRLRPFLSQNDYKTVQSWMNNVPENQRMPKNELDKSVAILSMLKERGMPYTVTKDKAPGQLKANIGNSKISIRLTDTAGNTDYIGRVYKDGYSIYIHPLTDSRKEYKATMEDMMACINYSLGESVARQSSRTLGKNVGMPAVTKAGSACSYVSKEKKGFNTLFRYDPLTEKEKKFNEANERTKGFKKINPTRVEFTMKNNHSSSYVTFESPEKATEYLKEAITSAKENFVKEVDVERLIQEAKDHAGDESYTPEYSGNPMISPIQREYWEVLSGGKTELYRPDDAHTKELVDMICASLFDEEASDDVEDEANLLKGDTYTGTPDEKVRQHLSENVEMMFGSYEPDSYGKRFNPVLVSSFMTSANSIYRNNDNLTSAMRELEFDGDELRGNDFQTGMMKDKLLRFDEQSAKPLCLENSDFMKMVMNNVQSAIQETGCYVKPMDILIDDNGVIQYTALQADKRSNKQGGIVNESKMLVKGQIGQVFEPDKQGVVETRFNGSENHLFSPGYMAYILPQKQGEHKPMEERMRFRGYKQTLAQNLREQIRYDLMSGGVMKDSPDGPVKTVGETTSVNNTYRGLYESRYSVEIERLPGESLKQAYLRETQMANLPQEVVDARFETNSRLVKFPTDLKEGSSIDADYKHRCIPSNGEMTLFEMTNDNVETPYELTGRKNMSVMDEDGDGYFDSTTTGSSKNQGIIRYAAAGAEFTDDGRLIPSSDKNDVAPIMKLDIMKYASHTPFDRQQMVFSNLMSASGVSKKVGLAQMTLCGKTFDDGAVISKDFAEEYGVVGEDGKCRPLVIGDKICDFAGNKCIVADVIDRNMTKEEAIAANRETEVELFKKNPKLDVVMAPYSATSRFNAGSAKMLMENPEDIIMPDGKVMEGCMGFSPIIITDKKVEEKTKLYDEDEVKAGGGRKISSQLAWAFDAKGAVNLLDECYSGNNGAITNFREYLIAMGLDMSETGTLRKGYVPHDGEERHIFQLLSDDEIVHSTPRQRDELFKQTLDNRGGFMEIPFPVTLPSGVQTPPIPTDKSSRPDRVMYALPVLSSYLRSGQEFEDGTSKTHDYTNYYSKIFDKSVQYLELENAIKERDAVIKANNGDSKSAPALDSKFKNVSLESLKREVTLNYSNITDSIRTRKFEGKHNAMRDDFMAHRMPYSATAVWTPNPSLDLDCVAMSKDTMKVLGVKENDHTMVWRDPMLREEGARYLRIVRDDALKGVAINPMIAVAFDGDFDGDSVGLYAPKRKSSQEECMNLFSFQNTMLDETKLNPDGTYKLMINDTMDIKSAEYLDKQKHEQARLQFREYVEQSEKLNAQHESGAMSDEEYKEKTDALGEKMRETQALRDSPTLEQRRLDIERRANEIHADKSLSDEERLAKNTALLHELSDWGRDALGHTCGTAMISYKDMQSHADSVLEVVRQGAKGSMSKAGEYLKYFGATYDVDKSGNIIPESVKDTGHSLATREDKLNTEYATAVKAFGTGIAGSISQRLITVCRNTCASPALRLTYNSTQGVLQAKHDPVLARQQYEMLQSTTRHLWKGHKLEAIDITDDNGNTKKHWKPVMQTDDSGRYGYVQATKDEWIKTFMDVHESKDGVNVAGCINPEHVKMVADSLCNPQTGLMYDIEAEDTKEKLASPMDRLAYGGDFKLYVKFAEEKRNLFDGKYNEMFASSQIRKNREAERQGEDLRAIVKSDVQEDAVVKTKNKALFEVNSKDPNLVFHEEPVSEQEVDVSNVVSHLDDKPVVQPVVKTPDAVSKDDFERKDDSEHVQETVTATKQDAIPSSPSNVPETEKTENVGFDFSRKAEPVSTVEAEPEPEHKVERNSGSCAQVAEDAKAIEEEKHKDGDFGDN